ncbi:hypothetical protein ABK040_012680 [Willaertia magna]
MLTNQQIRDLEISPDVLSKAHVDNEGIEMNISYGKHALSYGCKLTPTQAQHEPTIHIKVKDLNKYKPGHYLTLFMTDPDAPSRESPIRREWLHYIHANMPIKEDGTVDSKAGQNIAEYVGAGPPEGSGYHRYVYTLFYHENKLQSSQHWKLSGRDRPQFRVENWMKGHVGSGSPIAVACFEAEWDEYVPELYKKLGH